MTHISDIKLIRTYTTLDLSQKAEKGMLYLTADFPFHTSALFIPPLSYTMWESAFETRKSSLTHWTRKMLADAIICKQRSIAFGGKGRIL